LLPVFAALLGCGLILGFAKPAEARMRFCNHSGQKLAVSWAWKDIDRNWISEGHYIYESGECANVYSLPLRSRIYYYYAQSGSTPTHSTSNNANRKFCINDNERYKITHGDTSKPYKETDDWKKDCTELGDTYRLREFRQIDTGRLGIRCTVYLKRNGSSRNNCSLL